MKIAILQFSPRLGAVAENMSRADALLAAQLPLSPPTSAAAGEHEIDLLALPELAFTGYNFRSLAAISPFLEPTASGPSTLWAARVARERNCFVVVGYPERSAESGDPQQQQRNYNASVILAPDGSIVAHYRKSFLYYTDETWAEEGFRAGGGGRGREIEPFCVVHGFGKTEREKGTLGHGICMDINPYRFEAPWANYEFATTMLRRGCALVVLSMAWLTRLAPEECAEQPERPDMETVAYWRERFWPMVESQPAEPIIVVFANRCGSEGEAYGSVSGDGDGGEGDVVVEAGDRVAYAGSSCVMRFQGGSVKLWEHYVGPNKGDVGLLGKGEEGILVVDTAVPAGFLLQPKAG